MKRYHAALFIGIAIIGTMLRLYHLGAPIADWHSWRQVDTAAVARNFLKFGVDPLRPRFDDLSNIPSGKDNPEGFRMVEFPVYQLVGAWISPRLPMFSIESTLRLLTIGASVGSAIVLGLILMHLLDPLTGIIAAFVYAVLPYSMYYGRTTLPDPHMVFWSLVSLLLVARASESKGKTMWFMLMLSAASGALALLIKPPAIFLLLPAPFLIFQKFAISKRFFIVSFVYAAVCVVPLLLWRKWITQFPEGIPVYAWLFNEGNIRFKGAWFFWLFGERVKLILGYWGIVPLSVGVLTLGSKKEGWFLRLWLLGALLYLIIIARGNVQHDYYQILILPIVCAYCGKGLAFLLTNKIFSRPASFAVAAFSFFLMMALSWYTVRTYYWINRQEIVDTGKYADALLPKDAKVIAPYNGDTTFLYQINRQGWPIGFDIDKKIAQGATHYVTISPTDQDLETRDLAKAYSVLVRNDKFAIIDLTKPK